MKRIAFFLLLLSTGAHGEDVPWYTVEMLIFERTDPGAGETEHWPYDPGSPELRNTVELARTGKATSRGSAGSTPTPYRRLAEDQLALSKARKKLQTSKRYRVLLHAAWRQQGLDKKMSRPVHIRSSNYPLPPPSRRHPSTAGRLQKLATTPSVEGTVRIYRTRYLHFEADLRYFRPRSDASSGGDFVDEEVYLTEKTIVPTHFRLTESRRMRSRELHYLDHPLFGVLVQIIPYGVSGDS